MIEGKRAIDDINAELLSKDGNIDNLTQEIARLKEEKEKNDREFAEEKEKNDGEIAELKESVRIMKIHIEMLFTETGMFPANDKRKSAEGVNSNSNNNEKKEEAKSARLRQRPRRKQRRKKGKLKWSARKRLS